MAALLLATLVAPAASAEVVHTRAGHFLGVAPHFGLAPSYLAGALAARGGAAQGGTSQAGTVTYHGGSVVHSSAPYLIFWTPPGQSIPAATQSLLERYFSDVAGASGASTNVYGVLRQYTDGTGFADYSQTFNPSTQVITDTAAYPPRDSANCPDVSRGFPTCITDVQLESELAREVTAQGLPSDGRASAGSLPSPAPIYFVVLPTDVNVCYSSGSSISCADNDFCAYHSSFTDSAQNNLLYAAIPTLIIGPGEDPKNCQWDSNPSWPVQDPNGSYADVVLKYVSHEDSEATTDPLGYGWYDNSSGNEVGDNCNTYGSTADPTDGYSPDAFAPVLGGSASAGTLYDQLIGGHKYYLQSEWSNADGGCEMQPTPGSISPSFTTPAGTDASGSALTFNPAASTSSNPYAGASWNFGDGTVRFVAGSQALNAIAHTYSASGNYTVTLTLIDSHGNVATASRRISVYSPPVAAFSTSPDPVESEPTAFDGGASSDPDPGVTITSYAWTFGDGGTARGSSVSHTFAQTGAYTVTLTVTNSVGLSSSVSQVVTVADEPPVAAFTSTVAGSGEPSSFDGTGSSDPDGTITSYSWDYGDGSTGSGATPTHTYQSAGTYTVTLTVTDSDGLTATVSHPVSVPGPIPSFTASAAMESQPMSVNGTLSHDSQQGVSITSYTWNFGDGTILTGQPSATHTYAEAGTYWITLTLADSTGYTSSLSQQVIVADEPPVAAFTNTADPGSGLPATFDATASNDPDGTIVSYAWNFGDGTTGGGATPAHVFAAPGSYDVSLTVTDSDNQTATTSQEVTVAGPTASIQGASSGMVDAPLSFDGSASVAGSAGGPLSYSWSFDDGATASGPTVTHAFSTPGPHAVTLTVANAAGQTDSQTQMVTVADEPPIAAFSVTGGTLSTAHAVQFNATASSDPDGTVTAYSWSFGDGTRGSGATPTHLYSGPGTYVVQLTVTDSGGQTSAPVTHLLVVHAPPRAAFSVSSAQPVQGSTVWFDAGASTESEAGMAIAGYSWSFGDGTNATVPRPSHTYARAGTYTVTLTVTNAAGLADTVSERLTVVHALPVPELSVTTTRPVAGVPVRFDASGSHDADAAITRYSWSFGDGATAGGPEPSGTHTYARRGVYTVTLTVSDSYGRRSLVSETVTVAPAGRITALRVRPSRAGAMLLVTLSTAGRLRIGTRWLAVHHAGVLRAILRLSRAQLRRLEETGQLSLPSPLLFEPVTGPRSRRTVTVVLRFAESSGRLTATLH